MSSCHGDRGTHTEGKVIVNTVESNWQTWPRLSLSPFPRGRGTKKKEGSAGRKVQRVETLQDHTNDMMNTARRGSKSGPGVRVFIHKVKNNVRKVLEKFE